MKNRHSKNQPRKHKPHVIIRRGRYKWTGNTTLIPYTRLVAAADWCLVMNRTTREQV